MTLTGVQVCLRVTETAMQCGVIGEAARSRLHYKEG